MNESSHNHPSIGRIPFLWKKRIINLINQDPEKAIEFFFTNYLLDKDSKQMKFGLENTLPLSLNYIVSKLESLNEIEVKRIIFLLDTTTFLDSLLSLKKEEMKKIVSKITLYLSTDNKKNIGNILGQFDPSISLEIYDRVEKEEEEDNQNFLLSIWMEVDIRVFYLLLEKYLNKPSDHILSIFNQSSSTKLLSACKAHNYPFSLQPYSEIKLNAFLRLFKASEEELDFLVTSFSKLPKDEQGIFIEWLNSNTISLQKLLKSISLEDESKITNLVTSYFTNDRYTQKHDELTTATELVSSYFFHLTAAFIADFDRRKDRKGVNLIFQLLNNLDQDLAPFQDFFIQEFQKYGYQDFQEIIKAYFTSGNDKKEEILRTFLLSNEKKNWKPVLEKIIQERFYLKTKKLSKLFIPFESSTKGKITNELAKKTQLGNFLHLFSDYHFFQPLIVLKECKEPPIYFLLIEILLNHYNSHTEDLIKLGPNITFPIDLIASHLDSSQVQKLIDIISLDKSLLDAWEEALILRPSESQLYLLPKLEMKTKKNRNNIQKTLKKLITIDVGVFWEYISQKKVKNLNFYDVILLDALKESTPNLLDVLARLPSTHCEYLAQKIIQTSSIKIADILYSILSITAQDDFNENNIVKFLRIITKKDPQKIFDLILRRLSHISTIPKFNSFVKEVFTSIVNEDPSLTLSIIEENDLTSLLQLQTDFLNNLNDREFTKILIKVVPSLKTKNLRPSFLNQCLRRMNQRNSTSPFLIKDLLDKGRTDEFSEEGKKFMMILISHFIGTSVQSDIYLIDKILGTLESLQQPLLIDFFSKISQSSFENILNASSLDLSGKEVIDALTYRFSRDPPEYPEKYYIALYQKTTNNEVKRAILPLIGESCSWGNLPFLMELPERNAPDFKTEYLNAIANFSNRFEIASPETLVKMWNSGLQSIYSSRNLQRREKADKLQSFCPKCNNPVLEGQKSCGFCVQQLTCAICLKSIVNRADKDLIRCPGCSNFFHRNHLIASIRIRNECPICRKTLSLRDIQRFESYTFLYQ